MDSLNKDTLKMVIGYKEFDNAESIDPQILGEFEEYIV